MEGSHAPPPFLTKTYEMVEDPLTNTIVSWSQSGHSFVVWNPPEFAQHLLPKYFKHNNFSSFVRQLNTYGFRKVDPDLWEFANEEFIRGQRHLLKHIHRRKPIHSHSAHNQGPSVPLTDSERQEVEEEIQRLKHDSSFLQLQLQRQKQEKQEFEIQVNSLGGRLHAMEYRQKQMMRYLAQELQKPSFTPSFMQPSEIHNRKRRLLISNCLYDEANMGEEENLFLSFNMENADSTAVPVLNMDLIGKLDSSLSFWQNFLYQVGQTLWEGRHDCGVLVEPSAVITADINASSKHFAVTVQQRSPPDHPSPPDSRDVHFPTELAGSPTAVGNPALPSICLNIEACPKSGIDVNSGPAIVSDIDGSAKRVEEKTTKVNDVFWEQFLTEAPGSSDKQEVQSRRRDVDVGNESKHADHHKYWLNMNNVDSLTKQMGHLTPAGKA